MMADPKDTPETTDAVDGNAPLKPPDPPTQDFTEEQWVEYQAQLEDYLNAQIREQHPDWVRNWRKRVAREIAAASCRRVREAMLSCHSETRFGG